MITKELLINEFRDNCERYLTQWSYYSYYSPKVFEETKDNWTFKYLEYIINLGYNPLEIIYEVLKSNIAYFELFIYPNLLYDYEPELTKKIYNICLIINEVKYKNQLSGYYENNELIWNFNKEKNQKYKNLESKNPKEFELYRNKLNQLIDDKLSDYLNYEKSQYFKLTRINHEKRHFITFYTDTKTYKIGKNYYFGFLVTDRPFHGYVNEFLIRLLKIKSAKNNARFIKKLEKIVEEIKKVDVTYDEYRANMNNPNFDKTFFQFSLHPKYYPQIVAYKDLIYIHPNSTGDNLDFLKCNSLKDLESYYHTKDVITCYEMVIKNYYKIVNE